MSSLNSDGFEKFKKRAMDEPLVPLGCLLTAGVLIGGIVSFKRGNKALSQQLMRARVAAQMGTLGALAYGAYYTAKKNNGPKRESMLDKHLNLNEPSVAVSNSKQ